MVGWPLPTLYKVQTTYTQLSVFNMPLNRGLTLPGQNYTGPFNELKGKDDPQPKGHNDAVSREHDYEYQQLGIPSYFAYNSADEKAINNYDTQNTHGADRIAGILGKTVFNAKRVGTGMVPGLNTAMKAWEVYKGHTNEDIAPQIENMTLGNMSHSGKRPYETPDTDLTDDTKRARMQDAITMDSATNPPQPAMALGGSEALSGGSGGGGSSGGVSGGGVPEIIPGDPSHYMTHNRYVVRTSNTYKITTDNTYDLDLRDQNLPGDTEIDPGGYQGFNYPIPWKFIPNNNLGFFTAQRDWQRAIGAGAVAYRVKSLHITIHGLYHTQNYALGTTPEIRAQDTAYMKICEPGESIVNNQSIVANKELYQNPNFPQTPFTVGDEDFLNLLTSGSTNSNVLKTARIYAPGQKEEATKNDADNWYCDLDRNATQKLLRQGESHTWSWSNPHRDFISLWTPNRTTNAAPEGIDYNGMQDVTVDTPEGFQNRPCEMTTGAWDSMYANDGIPTSNDPETLTYAQVAVMAGRSPTIEPLLVQIPILKNGDVPINHGAIMYLDYKAEIEFQLGKSWILEYPTQQSFSGGWLGGEGGGGARKLHFLKGDGRKYRYNVGPYDNDLRNNNIKVNQSQPSQSLDP